MFLHAGFVCVDGCLVSAEDSNGTTSDFDAAFHTADGPDVAVEKLRSDNQGSIQVLGGDKEDPEVTVYRAKLELYHAEELKRSTVGVIQPWKMSRSDEVLLQADWKHIKSNDARALPGFGDCL